MAQGVQNFSINICTNVANKVIRQILSLPTVHSLVPSLNFFFLHLSPFSSPTILLSYTSSSYTYIQRLIKTL